MNRFIAIIVVILIAYSALNSREMYRADGTIYGKIQGEQREPVLVIDTVRFDNDSTATLVLNCRPSKTKANVSGTALLVSAIQQNVTTDRDSINNYVLHKQKGDTLTIWSSDADDTATVALMFLVQ